MRLAGRRLVRCGVGVLLLVASNLSVGAGDLPPVAMVEGLIGHPQQRNLSCESRSATDLAAYWGISFTEHAFFHRLPKSDNPHRGFVGDVDMPAGSMPPVGYGVYAGPVAATLRSFGMDAEARAAMTVDALKEELVGQRPVIVWATYDMQLPATETWFSSDGAEATVVRWQHTFIVVGYDEDTIYAVDAYDGVTKTFSSEAFVSAWELLDRMAVVVAGPLGRTSARMWMATEVGGRCQFLVAGRWIVGPR